LQGIASRDVLTGNSSLQQIPCSPCKTINTEAGGAAMEERIIKAVLAGLGIDVVSIETPPFFQPFTEVLMHLHHLSQVHLH